MKITSEKSLRNFEFWSGAEDAAKILTFEELDQIEEQLEEIYPEGMDETELNDLFWFDFDWILELIGKEECEECGAIFNSDEICECQED